MDVNDKLTRVKQSIDSVATHYDEDTDVLRAILDEIKEYCDTQRSALDQRIRDKIQWARTPKPVADDSLPEISGDMDATIGI